MSSMSLALRRSQRETGDDYLCVCSATFDAQIGQDRFRALHRSPGAPGLDASPGGGSPRLGLAKQVSRAPANEEKSARGGGVGRDDSFSVRRVPNRTGRCPGVRRQRRIDPARRSVADPVPPRSHDRLDARLQRQGQRAGEAPALSSYAGPSCRWAGAGRGRCLLRHTRTAIDREVGLQPLPVTGGYRP
jgi:hypothetical protein